MNSIPPEAQPFAIAAALLAVSALVLAWLLRVAHRARASIKRQAEDLESHLLRAQRDLASCRDDAAEWRARMQEQFESFRSAMNGQLTSAEARHERLQRQFDESSREADKVERELRTQVEVLRGMCAELPYARERLQAVGRCPVEPPSTSSAADSLGVAPLPALFEESAGQDAEQASEPSSAEADDQSFEAALALPFLGDARCNELEAVPTHADDRSVALQPELIATGLRSARAVTSQLKLKPRWR